VIGRFLLVGVACVVLVLALIAGVAILAELMSLIL
jgi:hypothetical protein